MTCLKCGAVDWDHVCYKDGDKPSKDMTYQEISDTLYAEDPGGVIDLIYFLLEKNPEWQQEIKNWKF